MRMLRCALPVLLVAALSAVLPTPASAVAPGEPAAAAFTNQQFGFAEGANIVDAHYAQHLSGMLAFAGTNQHPWLRLDLDWAHLEPAAGQYTWTDLDAAVGPAAAAGFRVMLILDNSPSWANGNHGDGSWLPSADNADAAWTSMVDSVVRHYAGTVQAYEVWNEPNNFQHGQFGTGTVAEIESRYWQLVKDAYPVVHGDCPACVVLAGGSAGILDATGKTSAQITTEEVARDNATWLRDAYTTYGAGDDFDAVTTHPYPPANHGQGPAQQYCGQPYYNGFGPVTGAATHDGLGHACGELTELHDVLGTYDPGKRIWATEWGYPTGGESDVLTLQQVRDFDAQAVAMWRSVSWTGPILLYSYRDAACGDQASAECHFGMVTRDFTPKDILTADVSAAFQGLSPAALATNATLRRWSSLASETGAYALRLQGDGNLVLTRTSDGHPLWATGTTTGEFLINQGDGNLVLYDINSHPVWATNTTTGAVLRMQSDGNLVYYDATGHPVWASDTFQS